MKKYVLHRFLQLIPILLAVSYTHLDVYKRQDDTDHSRDSPDKIVDHRIDGFDCT